ncbi:MULTISPECIES: hypothetical protein [unclassified Streptomyces]|uniref:hypothetical protein n=1 Tax=unclassified Streptomyces TaxID=2593676 RepID=UPI00224D9C7A|nr:MULTISPECIES: hypothetical protein [unclassified Streptomyces]WSP56583.1 hypothetical protein OG306_21125 [Streptomyces sp. NBC_01241]WSU22699.1 hypothetical protein OG508_18105 [Streptomyces sp. NBC_01108]MCX4788329.1 hypothetical protein [Streptomyces sp. NBC_01221]MCX4795913.1 hypothetical protein [Streptomyces sp. NBC_01242]WSJ37191.1 hypothetical protein OG772_14810 [Streptomyces sp. NBC_01321]
MADNEDGGTGTFKVTEGWLKGEARNKVLGLQGWLQSGPDYATLGEYATESGVHKGLLAGSGTLGADATLHKVFTQLCSSLKTQLDILGDGFTTLSIDMATVDTILQNSEDDAALTAEQMNMELANALKEFGGAPTAPPNP